MTNGEKKRKRPNSRRNLDIAIDRMAVRRGDPLRVRNAMAAAVVAQMIPDGVIKAAAPSSCATVTPRPASHATSTQPAR